MEAVTLPDSGGLPPWAYIVVVALIALPPTIIAWMNFRQAQAIKHQVQNDHSTNLREEMDERHAQIVDRLDQYHGCLGNISRALDSLDRRTARIGDEVREDRADFDELRRTTHQAIRRAESVIAKHHPEEG